MTDTKRCKACGETKPLDAYAFNPSGSRKSKCRDCKEAATLAMMARKAERQEELRLEAADRTAAMHDEIWAAMMRGRSRRALRTVRRRAEGIHRIRVRDFNGYVSVAEIACRQAEHDAARRAVRTCTCFEDAARAASLLDRDTLPVDRAAEMRRAFRTVPPQRPSLLLQDALGEPEDDERDAFEEAFGDWAPSWMEGLRLAA